MTEAKTKEHSPVIRLCLVCRKQKPRECFLRLTAAAGSGEVLLNVPTKGTNAIHGRSAYICPNSECIKQALKGTRLKSALEGGRGRKNRPRRQVNWPLESSLIHTLTTTCTEKGESCQNSREGG